MSDFAARFTQKLATESFFAYDVQPSLKVKSIEAFWYNTRFLNPTIATSPLSNLIQIQADSDFMLHSISAGARFTGAGLQNWIGNMTLQITDRSTGKTFFNSAQNIRTVAGADGFPFELPVHRVIRPNSVLQFDLSVAANTYDRVWISLSGSRVFYEATQ